MAGATLSLGKSREPLPPGKPMAGPIFNPEAHFGEVCGLDGAAYVQGKSLFNRAKQYVGPAPEAMCLTPLTAEQEQTRRKQMLVNKKFFGTAPPVATGAAIPKTILDAERENARARAVETRAA